MCPGTLWYRSSKKSDKINEISADRSLFHKCVPLISLSSHNNPVAF